KIQIDYETNKLSPALYWLSPAQTASGTHPFLLSNNKFIFARSVFPCQDTPSVKFTYSATITVPKDFTVLMPALLSESIYSTFNRYKFLQTHPVASYAVIIAVGSLQKRRINSQTNVFAENRFINEAVKTFHTDIIENMLKIAEHFCGPYCWGAILKREVNNTNSVDIELNPLIPNLLQALPINYIKYIPYDLGCELLNTLENKLGSSAFEAFFKFYFHHFAFKSITTDDWKSLLFKSFPENKKELESIEWNYWFYNIPTNLLVPHCKIAWETECLELVEGWATWDDNTYNVPPIIYKKQDFCNFEEIIFLDKLHSVYKQLTVKKIMLMSKIYFFETKSYQIRFLWLLLCIKVGWYDKILDSLQFVLLFCSSDHICTLFRDIMHVYPEYHSLLIITFEENKEKMLSYTQDKLKLILFQQN
ncbi:Leukotriene A-4 hydrolase, partial [Cyphomyrmex costatus]